MSSETQPKDFAEVLDALPPSIHWQVRGWRVVQDELGTTGTSVDRVAELAPIWFRRQANGELQPLFGFSGEGEGAALKKCVNALDEKQWERIEKRSTESPSAMVRATFSDFLWATRGFRRGKKAHSFAKQAIEAHLSVARQLRSSPEAELLALESCRLAASIALEIRQPESALDAVTLVHELVDAIKEQPRYPLGVLLAASHVVRDACKGLARTELGEHAKVALQAMLRSLLEFMPDNSPAESSPEGRDVLEERMNLEAQLGMAGAGTLRLRVGESFATQAHDRAAASDFILAGAFADHAMRVFANEGATERAEEMKRLLREWNEQSLPQMGVFTVSVQIPVELVKGWIADVLLRETLAERIRCAFESGPLIPDWLQVEKNALERAEEFPLLADMPVVSTVDGRPVDRQSDGRLDFVRREWQMSIEIGAAHWWARLSTELCKTEGFSERFTEDLLRSGILPLDRAGLARRALEASRANDCVVACYLLPPILESCLRNFLGRSGVDMNGLRAGLLSERLLGEPFSNNPDSQIAIRTKEALGIDLWNWYRVVLVDEAAGFNLRNRVAHGLLTDDECTPHTVSLLTLGLAALLTLAPASDERT